MLKGGQAAPQPPVASGEATPGSEAAVAPAPVAPTQEATVAIGGASGSGASKALNPDISIIGDFIATGGHNPIRKNRLLRRVTRAGFINASGTVRAVPGGLKPSSKRV